MANVSLMVSQTVQFLEHQIIPAGVLSYPGLKYMRPEACLESRVVAGEEDGPRVGQGRLHDSTGAQLGVSAQPRIVPR